MLRIARNWDANTCRDIKYEYVYREGGITARLASATEKGSKRGKHSDNILAMQGKHCWIMHHDVN